MTLGKTIEGGTLSVRVRPSRARRALLFALSLVLAVGMLPLPSASAANLKALAPTSLLVNNMASYTAEGRMARNEAISQVVFTFENNTDLSSVTTASIGIAETPAGVTPTTIASITKTANTVTLLLNMQADPDRETIAVTVSNVRNPSQPGNYQYTVQMVGNQGNDTKTSPPFTLTANTSAVTVGPVGLSSTLPSAAVAATIPVTLGPNGRLAGSTAVGPNRLTITFPAGFVVPATVPAGSIQVNGVTPATVTSAGGVITISLAASQTLTYGSTVNVTFAAAFGLTTPATNGYYTVSAGTSAETGTGTSPQFRIYVPYLTVTISTMSLAFGALDPGTVTVGQTIDVTVDSSDPYTITRDVSGDSPLMGLEVTGTAQGFKPVTGPTTWTDSARLVVPWTTDPDIPLQAAIRYTVLQ